MELSKITTSKSARIATHGNSSAKRVWWVLHGYGQLVPYFIRNFQELNADNNLVVAPEGLHRFYLQGTSGRVGASWMTKEEREEDISDYINYLDHVYESITFNQSAQHILLGFSQGIATAARWLANGKITAHCLVNWAGIFPPDLSEDELKNYIELPHLLVLGDDDQYWSDDNRNDFKKRMEEQFNNFQYFSFAGKHKIDSPTLKKVESWAEAL